MVGVTGVTRSHTRDSQRKGKGDMGRVTVGTEADFAAGETLETTQGGIVSGFPRIINLKRGLALIHVARALHSMTPVNFVTTVSTVSTDKAIKSGSDCGDRIFRFAEYPHLEHVTGFSIVRRG